MNISADRIPWRVALVAFLALQSETIAQTSPAAEATKTAASTATRGFDESVNAFKKPADWLSLGGDFRVRNEYYNNIVTLKESPLHEQDVLRFRGRIWGSAAVTKDVSLNARLSFESRDWFKPAFVGAFKEKTGMEWRYALLDNLNLKWTNAFNQPLTITAGRQDILLGDFYDWWFAADGTPGDGSWAFFLDAIRMTAEVKDLKTKFDVIFISHSARPDAWLPTLGSSSNHMLVDQDEQGVILYASNKSVKNTQIDGYFVYKNDQRRTFTIAGVQKTPGDNADIGTLGGKITGTPAEHWQYSVEAAGQFGSKYDRVAGVFARRDIRAYGAKGKLSYLFKDQLNNQVGFGGELLSGDDPKTKDRDEMFDVLWGRWPRWSELYIYSYINETSGKVAQLNNVGRLEASWTCVPVKGTNVQFVYNSLFAPEETPTRTVAPALFSNRGSFRGHYVQAILKRQFNKYLSGHLWGEWIWEGNYYAQRDLLTFIRAEVMVTF